MTGIKKLGIIGEGKMGSGIFHYLLDFGFDLTWVCSAEADPEKLGRQTGKRIRRMHDAGIIDAAGYERLLATPITADVQALSGCDLVIEAIPENREMKRDLFARLDKVVREEAVFASNSSSINPSELMPGNGSRRQFAGIHFFYPVVMKDIVEVTLAPSTTLETRLKVESFLGAIRRSFITTGEQHSFLLNRIFLEVQNEAFLIVRQGSCSFSQMDRLVRERLFPFGIFDFCDSVGLDVMQASVRNYCRNYANREHYSLFLSAMDDLVGSGKQGMKSGEGFHSYPLAETAAEIPGNATEIESRLRSVWVAACRDLPASAGINPGLMEHAVREYFGTECPPR